MKTLIVIPLKNELDFISSSCIRRGFAAENTVVGKLPAVYFPALELTLALGGLGKAQFAVQTQHLLGVRADWDVVVCAGAAGGLSDTLAIGDVVVATTTFEHDFINNFGSPVLPRFDGHASTLADLKRASQQVDSFNVLFGFVASGDEDVIDPARRQVLEASMGALAVAWEGAGGARACKFNDMPFVEIRGITDAANESASSDFKTNLELAMNNVAVLVTHWITGT